MDADCQRSNPGARRRPYRPRRQLLRQHPVNTEVMSFLNTESTENTEVLYMWSLSVNSVSSFSVNSVSSVFELKRNLVVGFEHGKHGKHGSSCPCS
jgi:hypothetical protein